MFFGRVILFLSGQFSIPWPWPKSVYLSSRWSYCRVVWKERL